MALSPPRCYPPRPRVLSHRTFNIHDSRGFGLAQAIGAVHIGSFNPMIMTDTNITDQDYCPSRLEHDVVCLLEITAEAGGAPGGVGLVIRN